MSLQAATLAQKGGPRLVSRLTKRNQHRPRTANWVEDIRWMGHDRVDFQPGFAANVSASLPQVTQPRRG
jgi:hypothetical protein